MAATTAEATHPDQEGQEFHDLFPESFRLLREPETHGSDTADHERMLHRPDPSSELPGVPADSVLELVWIEVFQILHAELVQDGMCLGDIPEKGEHRFEGVRHPEAQECEIIQFQEFRPFPAQPFRVLILRLFQNVSEGELQTAEAEPESILTKLGFRPRCCCGRLDVEGQEFLGESGHLCCGS